MARGRRTAHASLVSFPSLALVVVLTAVGCADNGGEGRFDVDGLRKFRDCLSNAFPLEPTFMATRERVDSTGMYLQNRARVGPDGDLVYLEVFDHASLADNPGQTVSIDYPPGSSPSARGEVATWESCPDTNVSLAVDGTVRFDAFGTDAGDRMTGEITEGRILDARTDEVVAESFTGSWDFEVEIAAPHRTYPNLSDDYERDP